MAIKFQNGLILTFVFALSMAGTARGQAAAGKPAFEVASIRPSAPIDVNQLAAQIQAGRMPRMGAHVDGSRAEYDYMSVKDLIANAYGVKTMQVTGPAWLASERFDIVAKMPDGASKDEAPTMLQSLLAERFKLTAHTETQEHPVMALVVGKDGPKMKEVPAPPAPLAEDAPLGPGEVKLQGPDGPIRVTRNGDGTTTMNMGAKGIITQRIDMASQTVHLESSATTMAGFADMLTNLMRMGGGDGRQVVDMTGLKGNYQVAVDVSMTELIAMARERMRELGMDAGALGANAPEAAAAAAGEASDPSGGSSLFASVEKMGLKMEQRKTQAEQVVVDHMEKTATEN
jgi:uncharacterized protein (TIGR03435 family)